MHVQLGYLSLFADRFINNLEPICVSMLNRAFVPGFGECQPIIQLNVSTERHAILSVFIRPHRGVLVPAMLNRTIVPRLRMLRWLCVRLSLVSGLMLIT